MLWASGGFSLQTRAEYHLNVKAKTSKRDVPLFPARSALGAVWEKPSQFCLIYFTLKNICSPLKALVFLMQWSTVENNSHCNIETCSKWATTATCYLDSKNVEGFSYSFDSKILINALVVIQCGQDFSTVASRSHLHPLKSSALHGKNILHSKKSLPRF